MAKKNSGGGLSMDAKRFIIFSCCCAILACKASKDSKLTISNLHDKYPMQNIDQFWSSPIGETGNARSIGFVENRGLYVLWEQTDGLPMTNLHSAYGNYIEDQKLVILSNPFGDDFRLKKHLIDEVEILFPEQMSLEKAKAQQWLLIRREGATALSPFAFKNHTNFDSNP